MRITNLTDLFVLRRLILTNKLKRAEGITEFENEPAFVRRNIQVNLDTPSNENPISRFGLSDDDAGSGLRNNNFLHDNVD